jgi:plastocyanin
MWCKRRHTAAIVATIALGTMPGIASADPEITFRYATYTPNSVRIAPGQSVTWRGDPGNTFGATSHPLVFTDPAIPPQLDSSSTTTRGFETVGRFAFHCANHGQFGMTGAISVTANHLPSAHISGPSSTAPGVSVSFDASGSSDPDPGQTLTFTWDFDGDGNADRSGAAPTASFTYTQVGRYTVKLTVTDSNGEPGIGPESGHVTREITVDPSAPHGDGGPTDSGSLDSPTDRGSGTGQDDVALELPGPTTTRSVRRRGLAVRVRASKGSRAAATLKIGSRIVGRATATIGATGARTMRIALTRRGQALLANRRRVRAHVHVVVTDVDGHATSRTRAITLRR